MMKKIIEWFFGERTLFGERIHPTSIRYVRDDSRTPTPDQFDGFELDGEGETIRAENGFAVRIDRYGVRYAAFFDAAAGTGTTPRAVVRVET